MRLPSKHACYGYRYAEVGRGGNYDNTKGVRGRNYDNAEAVSGGNYITEIVRGSNCDTTEVVKGGNYDTTEVVRRGNCDTVFVSGRNAFCYLTVHSTCFILWLYWCRTYCKGALSGTENRCFYSTGYS